MYTIADDFGEAKGAEGMAIKSITLENFTVFKNTELDFCNGVNILIGENGTGKTHLLKLLYATHLTHSNSNYSINSITTATQLKQQTKIEPSTFGGTRRLYNFAAYSSR